MNAATCRLCYGPKPRSRYPICGDCQVLLRHTTVAGLAKACIVGLADYLEREFGRVAECLTLLGRSE